MTEASIAQPETPLSSDHPSAATVQRLLQVNRNFYAAISKQFDQTRGSIADGMTRAIEMLYPTARDQGSRALRVLDAGCGNGRFARAVAANVLAVDYVGLDADEGLLAAASRHLEDEKRVNVTLVEADLSADLPSLPFDEFDLVASLAVLHHMPSRALRQRIVNRLAQVTRPDGRLLISTWQFMESERLAARVQPWEEVGLTAADVEPGDALLPWDQGVHALRYVHLIDETEIADLAASAQMEVIHTFRADGKSGNLSLYAIMKRIS